MGASDPGQVRRSFGQVNGKTLFVGKKMTDKDTAATVASEAVRAIRGMNALLKDYLGTALAHLYELQETETIRLIVGAQPLIPPMPDGLLKFKTSSIKEYKKFFFASVLAAWWFTRTVAVFDKEMVEELLTTDQADLQISVSQFARFLGNPVLIPFEKPYHDDGADILGCIVGFATDDPIGFNGLNSFVFLPVFMDPETELPNFAVGLARFNTRDKKQALPLRDLIGSVAEAQYDGGIPGFSLYRKELTSKLAYLLTETPDVNRCMSVSAPAIKRPRRRPETIFPPERPRFMPLGEEFGNLIRQYREREVTSGHTIHGTVRPHIRRAHWHTFLMGAGREKRILKWLPPTFVKSAELSEG